MWESGDLQGLSLAHRSRFFFLLLLSASPLWSLEGLERCATMSSAVGAPLEYLRKKSCIEEFRILSEHSGQGASERERRGSQGYLGGCFACLRDIRLREKHKIPTVDFFPPFS
jgi:hypothetical protein